MNFLEIVGFLIVGLLSWVAFKLISGYRFTKSYANYARKLGYKVYEFPFYILGFATYQEMKKYETKYGDAHYHYKNLVPPYDLVISNSISKTMV